MTPNLPSTQVYSLSDLDVNLRNQVVDFNIALLDRLHYQTLSVIKNAFARAVGVTPNGLFYIRVSELRHLLRTGNSGADNYMWQNGIPGYSSPSTSHTVDGNLCITGPDFLGLLQSRIELTAGKLNLYLKYVRAVYLTITSLPIIHELRNSFLVDLNNRRAQLKAQRISTYSIRQCEFTGRIFTSQSQVEFAHIDSVVTSPLQALNIDNGVIILKEIHAQLTSLGIHDFAGMYDYCKQYGYLTTWAENYNL
jgi:hypothetical protein